MRRDPEYPIVIFTPESTEKGKPKIYRTKEDTDVVITDTGKLEMRHASGEIVSIPTARATVVPGSKKNYRFEETPKSKSPIARFLKR